MADSTIPKAAPWKKDKTRQQTGFDHSTSIVAFTVPRPFAQENMQNECECTVQESYKKVAPYVLHQGIHSNATEGSEFNANTFYPSVLPERERSGSGFVLESQNLGALLEKQHTFMPDQAADDRGR